MKCCVSTDVGTWTNWLTFEPHPDYSPVGTGLLYPLSYKPCYTRNFTSRKSDVYVLVAAARRGFTIVSFPEAVSRQNTFVGGTCAPSSFGLILFVATYLAPFDRSHTSSNPSYIVTMTIFCTVFQIKRYIDRKTPISHTPLFLEFNLHDPLEPLRIFAQNFNTYRPNPWAIRWCRNIAEKFQCA